LRPLPKSLPGSFWKEKVTSPRYNVPKKSKKKIQKKIILGIFTGPNALFLGLNIFEIFDLH
jgi:hypothetical protein